VETHDTYKGMLCCKNNIWNCVNLKGRNSEVTNWSLPHHPASSETIIILHLLLLNMEAYTNEILLSIGVTGWTTNAVGYLSILHQLQLQWMITNSELEVEGMTNLIQNSTLWVLILIRHTVSVNFRIICMVFMKFHMRTLTQLGNKIWISVLLVS
jgi:hypothetical protein